MEYLFVVWLPHFLGRHTHIHRINKMNSFFYMEMHKCKRKWEAKCEQKALCRHFATRKLSFWPFVVLLRVRIVCRLLFAYARINANIHHRYTQTHHTPTAINFFFGFCLHIFLCFLFAFLCRSAETDGIHIWWQRWRRQALTTTTTLTTINSTLAAFLLPAIALLAASQRGHSKCQVINSNFNVK